MRKLWILSLVTFFISSLCLPLLSQDEDVFDVDLVRAADIPAPERLGPSLVPIGNDPLASGSLEVSSSGRVEIEVRGAAPNKDYRLMFCKAGFERNCTGLGDFRTDENGRAEAEFNFPVRDIGNPASGLFVVKDLALGGPGCGGDQCIQFINGFRIRR